MPLSVRTQTSESATLRADLRLFRTDVFKYPNWSLTDMNYFAYTQTLSLTVFGIAAGIIVYFYRRYKIILFVGLCIRLLAVGGK